MSAKLLISLGAAAALLAQGPPDPKIAAAHQQAMSKLQFLSGKWAGRGSIAMGPGEPHRFEQTENVQPKQGGTLLLIEGVGKETGTGRVIHEALAVISYDDKADSYRFRAFAGPGRYLETGIEAGEKSLAWGYASGPATVRFTIRLNEQGQWRETGTLSTGGQPPRQFFEMTLDRQP